MAKSELDKLLAATHTRSTSSGTDFSRLMAEVLKLGRTPKAPAAREGAPRPLPSQKAIKPESTTPARLLRAAPAVPASTAISLPASNNDLGRLAAQVDELQRAITPASEPVPVRTRSSTGTAAKPGDSNGILKFVSNFFGGSGLGSIVSGIAGLFGGGTPDAPPPLYQFTLPQSVSVEAGLTRGGQFVPVSYSQNGQARPNMAPQRTAPVSAQPTTVDSQWFLDHSEDIASAVKEAMLHSHSINDVVADL